MRCCLEYFRRPRKAPQSTAINEKENQGLNTDDLPSYTDLFGNDEIHGEEALDKPLDSKSITCLEAPELESDTRLTECRAILDPSSWKNPADGRQLQRLVTRCQGCQTRARVAGAYLAQTEVSCSSYLRRVGPGPKLDLSSALSLSLDQVKKRYPDAAQLFMFFAYFSSTDLAYDLIAAADVIQSTWISRVTSSPEEYQRTMACLQNYHLVERSSNVYRIEPQIHEWLVHSLSSGPLFSTFIMALRCIAFSHNSVAKTSCGHKSRRFIQHAEHITSERFNSMWRFAMQDSSHIEAVIALARCYRRWNQPEKAAALATPVMTARQQNQTPALSITAGAMSDLAKTLAKQGQRQEAEQLYRQAIDVFDADPLSDPTLRLKALRRLGCLYGSLGRLDECEAVLKTLLNTRLSSPWQYRDVSNIIRAYADLGLCRHEQGRYQQALALYRTALSDFESCAERNDTNVLLVYTRTGDTYYRTGSFELAEQAYTRAMLGYERRFGRNYKRTVNLRELLKKFPQREREKVGEEQEQTETGHSAMLDCSQLRPPSRGVHEVTDKRPHDLHEARQEYVREWIECCGGDGVASGAGIKDG